MNFRQLHKLSCTAFAASNGTVRPRPLAHELYNQIRIIKIKQTHLHSTRPTKTGTL